MNNLIEQLNVIPKTACGAVAIQIKVIYREIDSDLAILTTHNHFGLFYNNIYDGGPSIEMKIELVNLQMFHILLIEKDNKLFLHFCLSDNSTDRKNQ